MCAACDADLVALGTELAGVITVEAEACAMRIELHDRIERILDGQHSDTLTASAPVLEPPT